MEVTGRVKEVKEKKLTSTQNVNTLLFCVPCELDGTCVQACGYCQDCREHLCETCFRLHTRPTPLRHHVMLDSETMPKEQANLSVKSVKEDYELCDIHGKEQIKFYCEEHDQILCSICITVDHRRCKVNFIPGICKDEATNTEMQEILEELPVAKTKLKHELQLARNERQKSLEYRSKMVQDSQCFRKEINECINKLEFATTHEAESHINLNKHNVQLFFESIDQLMNNIDTAESELMHLRQQKEVEKLFIKVKKSKVLLDELEAKLRTRDENTSSKIVFHCNQTILNILRNEKFGLLTSPTKTISISDGKTIHNFSFYDCLGVAVMSPDEIVVIYKNAACKHTIFLFNIKERRVVSKLDIDVDMWLHDITCLPENQIAVTFPDNYLVIRIFSVTSTGITEIRSLRLSFQCFGIAYCEDKLIVTSYICSRDDVRDGQIMTLDMNGEVLCCFGGTDLIDLPGYIEISHDKKHFYLSEVCKNKVIKLDRKGNVINIFREKEKKQPKQIEELEDGSILVLFSDLTNSKILRLSYDLQMCQELELNRSDIDTFSYCKEAHQLYVVSLNREKKNAVVLRYDIRFQKL